MQPFRIAPESTPLALHRLWDGLLTSSNNVRTLRNMATELRSKFPGAGLTELSGRGAGGMGKGEF
jgi:hypothetical protein